MLNQVNLWWWVRVPRYLARVSPSLPIVAADGFYLAAWPRLGALAPLLAFAIGFICGSTTSYPNLTYTGSLAQMGAMFVPGNFSAALGVWVVAGYAISDTLIGSHPALTPHPLISVRIPLLISYALLSILVVVIPLRSNSVRRATVSLKSQRLGRIALNAGLLALIQGALVLAWTQAAAVLIRPVFTWSGDQPTTAAIAPLQQYGWILAVVAAALAIARVIAMSAAARKPQIHGFAQRTALAVNSTEPLTLPSVPAKVQVVARAALWTLMLSGLLTSWTGAVLTGCALVLVFGVRHLIGSRLAWLRNVPVLLRLVIAAIAAYAIAYEILSITFDRAATADTFAPLVVSLLIVLLLSAFLFPPQAPRAAMNRIRT